MSRGTTMAAKYRARANTLTKKKRKEFRTQAMSAIHDGLKKIDLMKRTKKAKIKAPPVPTGMLSTAAALNPRGWCWPSEDGGLAEKQFKSMSLDEVFDLEARHSANAGSGLGRKSPTIGAKKERPRLFRDPSTGLMITKGPINGPKVTNADVRAALDRADKEWSPGYASREEGVAALIIAEGGCVSVDEACYLYRKPIPVIRQTLVEAIFGATSSATSAGPLVQSFRCGSSGQRAANSKAFERFSMHCATRSRATICSTRSRSSSRPTWSRTAAPPLAALRDGEIKKVLDAVNDRGH